MSLIFNGGAKEWSSEKWRKQRLERQSESEKRKWNS
jgi:hypothetical protein